jgi:hypothetical protein
VKPGFGRDVAGPRPRSGQNLQPDCLSRVFGGGSRDPITPVSDIRIGSCPVRGAYGGPLARVSSADILEQHLRRSRIRRCGAQ